MKKDLPSGTPVMCRLGRGTLWEFQIYRKAGVTADYFGDTASHTAWRSICPLSEFKPDSKDWLPAPENDYSRLVNED